MSVCSGQFQLPVGTGTQDITGLPFQPNAVLLFSSWNNADDGYTGTQLWSWGWSDGTNHRVRAGSKAQGVFGIGDRWQSESKCIACVAGSLLATAHVDSFLPTGFRLNWTTNTINPATHRIGYIAFKATKRLAGTFTRPQINLGVEQVQEVTVGLAPSLVLFAPFQDGQESLDSYVADTFTMAMGWMAADGTQGYAAGATNNGSSGSSNEAGTDKCYRVINTNQASADYARFEGMTSTSFKIRHIGPVNSAPVFFLALEGIQATAGNVIQPTSVSTVTKSGLVFAPTVCLFSGVGTPDGGPDDDHVRWALGCNNTVQGGEFCHGGDQVQFGNSQRTTTNVKAWRSFDANATLRSEADVTLTADGFQLAFTTVNATAREVLFLAMTAGAPPPVFTLPNALAGKELIIPRVRLIYEDTSGNPETHLWSPLPIGPIGAEDQYTEERAVDIGDLVYALSDRDGKIQATSAVAEIADKLTDTAAPLARTWLDRTTGKTLRGREIWIELNSDKGIYRGDAWFIAFRGFVERVAAVSQFRFRFEALGWIFKRLKEPVLTLRVGDVFAGAPVESRARLVPLALGTLTDEPSATAPPTIVLDEAGRGSEAGPEYISGYGNIATAPTGLAGVEVAAAGNLMLGDIPGDAYVIQVTRIVAGVESDPMPFLPGGTTVTITGDNAAIDVTCTNDGADAYRFYIGANFYGARFSHYLQTTNPVAGVRFTDMPSLAAQGVGPITTNGVYAESPFSWTHVRAIMADGRTAASTIVFMRSAGYVRPVRFAWDPVAGALSYEVYWGDAVTPDRRFAIATSHTNTNGDPYFEYNWGPSGFTFVNGAPNSIGVIPPIYVGKFTDLTGFADWDGFLISGRPGTAFLGGYVGTERLSDHYSTTVAAPGLGSWTTWFGANNYIVTATGLRAYMIFLRGPLAYRARGLDPGTLGPASPVERFGVNVAGVNAVGNTATPPAVNDIYDLLAILADNGLLADAVNLMSAAAFVTSPPEFSDTTPRRDVSSFLQAKADAAVVVPGGAAAARWLASPMTWADLLGEWCPSANAKVGVNPDGSMRIVVTNPNGVAVATVSELTDILRDSFSFADTDQGYGNVQPYTFGQAYGADGSLTLPSSGSEEDTTSQARNDEVVPAAPIALPWRVSSAIARQIALAYLKLSAYLPRTGPLDGAMPLVERKVGELVQIAHREGTGAAGWADRKVQVLGLRISPLGLKAGLTWLDLIGSTSQLSLFLTEELMSTTYVGGDRHRSCVVFGAINVPINWIKFQVNWDDVPATHGIRVRVQVATTVGTIKPGVFIYPENPGANSPVVDGVTQANNDLENQEQTLIIPADSGSVFYWVLPTYAGGATVDTTRMYAVREAYRV